MLTLNNLGYTSIANQLVKLGNELAISNKRLSTGLRINSAADDPSGIVTVNRLEEEIAKIDASITNASRIGSIADTADGALSEITTLIEAIQTAVTAASGDTVSADERAAYQAEIDDTLDAIDRLVDGTSFNDTKILDGEIGYTVSRVDSNDIVDLYIYSSSTRENNSVNVTVEINEDAEQGELFIPYDDASPDDDVTLTITGNLGSKEYTFAAGYGRGNIAIDVNADSATTGVTALYDGTGIYFRSAGSGADQFVSINVTQGSYPMEGGKTIDYGRDRGVLVNGVEATVEGREVYFSTGTLSGSFSLTSAFEAAGGSTSFTVTGSGSGYSLGTESSDTINFGQGSINTTALGSDELGYLRSLKSGGTNDLASGNYTAAVDIATKALNQVAATRSRWGSLKSYTVDSRVNALLKAKEAMINEKSSILDLDYALETANNNRIQLLMEMASTIISAINNTAGNIVSLLRVNSS